MGSKIEMARASWLVLGFHTEQDMQTGPGVVMCAMDKRCGEVNGCLKCAAKKNEADTFAAARERAPRGVHEHRQDRQMRIKCKSSLGTNGESPRGNAGAEEGDIARRSSDSGHKRAQSGGIVKMA